MIRDATSKDLKTCLEMGWKFHEVSGMAEFIPFDDVTAVTTLSKLMDARGLLVMTAPDDTVIGMAGVFAAPSYFNSKFKMAQELFWWIEPEHRGKGGEFLSAVEERMRKLGADVADMACLEKQRPEIVGGMYERRGYTPIERHYYRSL